MSKRSRTPKPPKNRVNVVLILQTILFALITSTLSLISAITSRLKSTMLNLTAPPPEDPRKLSDKKRARLLNKQMKLLAEFRLMRPPPDNSDESSSKRLKLDDNPSKTLLPPKDFKTLKSALTERKRALQQLPKFSVNATSGLSASVFKTPYTSRNPLLLSDIQHLITYAYGNNELVTPPSRWCSLQKPNRLVQCVVLIVEGIGLNEFVDNEDAFESTMRVFGGDDEKNRGIVEFLAPQWYGSSVSDEIGAWGVLSDKTSAGEGRLECKGVVNQLASVFQIQAAQEEEESKQEVLIPSSDTFARSDLILTLSQQIQESYPLPIPATSTARDDPNSFTPTCSNYTPVSSSSRMFAIDCEMCVTEHDPQALTRIAVVDEDLATVYSTYVKPREEVKDYLTRWSGVTKEHLEECHVTLENVQERVKDLVKEHPNCILIGQSLNFDLKAMRMTHPYVIDTSVVFNLSGIEGRKNKLRDLAWVLLKENIQENRHHEKPANGDTTNAQPRRGHCPIEDAVACMKLVKAKLANGINFGNEAKTNSNAHATGGVLALDPAIINAKNKRIDKDVLLITRSTAEPKPPPEQTLPPQSNLKTLSSSSNKQTVKLLNQNSLTSFMTIGHYEINREDVEASSLTRSIKRLDTRVSKVFEHISQNSMFVVVCCNGSESTASDEHQSGDSGRRNNGVALIRVKSNESELKRGGVIDK